MTSDESELQRRLRALPQVDRVISALTADAPRPLVAQAARQAVAEARETILAEGDAPGLEEIVARAKLLLDEHERSLLTEVINATGVLIHTNLGRVPLSDEQLDAVAAVAGGYSNLEYELSSGRRGSRYEHATRLLKQLTGAEAALVVNNNAAAVFLVLASLCAGREVVISRGELIEIGGEFRIPEIMAASGAHLVEVGTTNRTHQADYERAIGAQTAALMKVHTSNYKIVGFTAHVPARALARVARGRGVYLIHDLGSGFLGAPHELDSVTEEPAVGVSLEEGADVVTFSGDKLLGGPQAGLILGRRDAVERISRHPLLRAVRPDKMTLAALEATLHIYLEGRARDLPLWRMALTPSEELATRAQRLAAAVGSRLAEQGVKAEAVASAAVAGGGSLPATELGSWALALRHSERSTAELERALRQGRPPVIGRIEEDRFLLDLRTVAPADDPLLESLVIQALSPEGEDGAGAQEGP